MRLGVGVIGAGTVGGGVIQILRDPKSGLTATSPNDLHLAHVCELNTSNLEGFNLDGVTVGESAEALYNDPSVNVVCELIGGIDPAKAFTLGALNAGKHVVTANKMLVAYHGEELTKAAIENNVEFRYEAAVAGGIPIIKALREGLSANHIEHIYGILNGTCNYILSRMTYEGLDFDTVLKQAQELGFAETPPDLDVQGHDTAHKCQILASLCYQSPVDIDAIPVEGITEITHADVGYAAELGYVIKLLAVIRKVDDTIDARVHPALIPEDHLLAAVRNEFNAVYVQGDVTDGTLYYGRGAGRLPTAGAVVADLVDIARLGDGTPTPPFIYRTTLPLRDLGLSEGRFYLRMTVLDRPGVFGQAATILGKHGVSIASCFQKDPLGEEAVHMILMTHTTQESSLREALTEVSALDEVTEPTFVIRVTED